MEFELVELNRGGLPTLHGLYAREGMDRGLVVHVHGMGSNFYENAVVNRTLALYKEDGYSVAALNFPGHDAEYRTENYDMFTPALNEWLDLLGTHSKLILQGHSLGNHKILSYENDARAKYADKVRAVIMLAPIDEVATWGTLNPEVQSSRLAWVRGQIEERGPRETIFDKEWMYWPMSAGTLARLLTEGDLIDQIRFRHGTADLGWRAAKRFMAIGEVDKYSVPSAADVVNMVASMKNISAHLITKADHDFVGNDDELISNLRVWLTSVIRDLS